MQHNREIIFIADMFYEDFTGGAELNDHALIKRLEKNEFQIIKKRSKEITIEFLKKNRKKNFIIGNFFLLGQEKKEFLSKNNKYVIYEHDHKYLKTRNPLIYPEFKAPEDELNDLFFYKNSIKTICLTKFALDVFVKNTGLKNVGHVGASIWLDQDLEFIRNNCKNKKNNLYAIMKSNNPIKKTLECIKFCNEQKIEYDLIYDNDNKKFLKKLSEYKGLIFKTGHLETCGRILVEAKMLNCKLIYQKKLVGAAYEPWFSLDGEELIEVIKKISNDSINIFISCFKEENI